MSGSELPPLRPLAVNQVALSNSDPDPPAPLEDHDAADQDPPLPWEKGTQDAAIEAELKAFCRAGELVYAAVVDLHGAIDFSVCTVGPRPHNETQIGDLVRSVFTVAEALGEEVGEPEPQGLNLQGSRWSYSLNPLDEGRMLFGIFSSKALPSIVRACAQKTRLALVSAVEGGK